MVRCNVGSEGFFWLTRCRNDNLQGFVFSTVRDLQYGLVQHQGGPCGILAVVQGYVLRFLLQQAPVDWKNVSTFPHY